jgi:cobyrinic acid a,c-diamide synthase
MISNYPRVILGALRGGSGKTILAMGMISAFNELGRTVVPFKKGPDFIDTGWLGYAAGRPCYNLDCFLLGAEQTLSSFVKHAAVDGLAVIEGNRGIFDGMDARGTFSTAELAKLLSAPILLIVDCTKSTRTVAALVLGCLHLDPSIHIGGVILNMVGTSRHESLIRRAVEEHCGIPVLGSIPRIRDNSLPERHMGLIPPQEHAEADRSVTAAKEIAREFLDLDRIWSVAMSSGPLTQPGESHDRDELVIRDSPRIGVIRDRSFWFYYPENVEDLVRLGAKVIEVNSLQDRTLPPLDGLYIGGGFPETHAHNLSLNESFRNSLLKAIHEGMPVYAECGGLMYLGRSLVLEHSVFPMVGAFAVDFQMEKKPQGHGYTILEADEDNSFFPKGTVLHGHEFHYSRPVGNTLGAITTIFKNRRGAGFSQGRDGLQVLNVLATYSHIHSAGAKEWAGALVERAEEYHFAKSLADPGMDNESVTLQNSASTAIL